MSYMSMDTKLQLRDTTPQGFKQGFAQKSEYDVVNLNDLNPDHENISEDVKWSSQS